MARREGHLHAAAAECRRAGAPDVVMLPADVADARQVREVALTVMGRYERIDVWVNNAAVTLFGRLEEAPLADFERVLRTNLLGYVHGARAVLPWFREQGRGILINVASVVAYLSQPYTSAYGVSKAGIRALSDSLRQELADAPAIHVCTVLPAAIDTPLFQMGANYTGRMPRPIAPVYSAGRVAGTVVALVRRPRREVVVGGAGRLGLWLRAVLPGPAERLFGRIVEQEHFEERPAPPWRGNLYRPVDAWNSVSGGWGDHGERQ